METTKEGLSYDTKTIIVILLLVFAYPIGLILMFVWMKWPVWVKLLVALPTSLIFLGVFGILAAAVLVTINPRAQIEKATMLNDCISSCQVTKNVSECESNCKFYQSPTYSLMPSGGISPTVRVIKK